MNFYGHAYLASEQCAEPAFLFGSMLPDFCTMSGLRLAHATDAVVRAGVEHHHDTDEVFHAAPTFVTLMGEGRDALEDRGVRMGPAMAVGHVGVELLLDGWLWRERARVAYTKALHAGARLVDGLEFRRGADGASLGALLERLVAYEVPSSQDDAEVVAGRLRRILQPRPRLALDPTEYEEVRRWVDHARSAVDLHAATLIEEVRAGLSARPST